MDFHNAAKFTAIAMKFWLFITRTKKWNDCIKFHSNLGQKKAKFFTSNNIILVVWTKYEQIHERHVGISTPQLNTDIITAHEFLVYTYRGKNTYFID